MKSSGWYVSFQIKIPLISHWTITCKQHWIIRTFTQNIKWSCTCSLICYFDTTQKRIHVLSFCFTHAATCPCHVSSVNRFVILFFRHFLPSTQQSVQGQTFLLRGLRRDGQRRLWRSFFTGEEEILEVVTKKETLYCTYWDLHFLFFFTDSFVSEQHPPAVTHDPSGHSWADPRLWPLPGPCGLVQQLQTSGLFRGKVLMVLLFFFFLHNSFTIFFFPQKNKGFYSALL